jgi:hypothetical protein
VLRSLPRTQQAPIPSALDSQNHYSPCSLDSACVLRPASDFSEGYHFASFLVRCFLTGTYRYSVSRLMPNSRASAAFESPYRSRGQTHYWIEDKSLSCETAVPPYQWDGLPASWRCNFDRLVASPDLDERVRRRLAQTLHSISPCSEPSSRSPRT